MERQGSPCKVADGGSFRPEGNNGEGSDRRSLAPVKGLRGSSVTSLAEGGTT
jgi:hypothetical protein